MKKFILILTTALFLASCTNHGDKVSKDYLEVFYKDGITKEQAEKALDYFYPLWKEKTGETKKKSMQFTKEGDTIHFRMVSNMEVMDKMDEGVFYDTGNEISENIFNGAPVNVVLTDNKFKTIRTYAFKKTDKVDYGMAVTAGNVEVYVKDGSKEGGEDLADYLNKTMKPTDVISFQLSKNADGFTVIKMASTPERAAGVSEQAMEVTAAGISSNVLLGAPLVFELTDTKFETIKTVNYKTNEFATDTIPVQ
jgi:hypothetical protein